MLADTAAARAAVSAPDCPRQRDACVDRLLADMQRNLDRIGCRHNAAFALLYLRTTERIRDAIRAGEFSDRPFWNQVTTAFGRYYLDALKAWRRGDRRHAPKAWRIAFRAARHERVSTLGDVFLGINAHVNRDLAFVYFRLGAKNRDDHLFVDTVLTRTLPDRVSGDHRPARPDAGRPGTEYPKRALRAGRLDAAGAGGELTGRRAAGRDEARARIGRSSFP